MRGMNTPIYHQADLSTLKANPERWPTSLCCAPGGAVTGHDEPSTERVTCPACLALIARTNASSAPESAPDDPWALTVARVKGGR